VRLFSNNKVNWNEYSPDPQTKISRLLQTNSIYRLITLLLSCFLITACASIIGEPPAYPDGSEPAQHANAPEFPKVHQPQKTDLHLSTSKITPENTTLWIRITFDSGSTFVDKPTHKMLHALAAKYLDASRHQLIVAQGFCDNEPIDGYTKSRHPSDRHYASQLALSEARADKVAEILMQSGIPHEVLRIEAFGASHFIDNNKNDSGREKNRRVDVFLVERP